MEEEGPHLRRRDILIRFPPEKGEEEEAKELIRESQLVAS